MSKPTGRRYGTPQLDERQPQVVNGRVKLVGYVEIDTHARAKAAAYAAGMSLGLYLTKLIEGDELDEQGRPTWAVSAQSDALPLAM
jgi:hypothetical protein